MKNFWEFIEDALFKFVTFVAMGITCIGLGKLGTDTYLSQPWFMAGLLAMSGLSIWFTGTEKEDDEEGRLTHCMVT